MRIGKPLEHAQAAVKSLDIADPVLKVTALGRQIGYAGYLVNDMLIWVRFSSLFHAPIQSTSLSSDASDSSSYDPGERDESPTRLLDRVGEIQQTRGDHVVLRYLFLPRLVVVQVERSRRQGG